MLTEGTMLQIGVQTMVMIARDPDKAYVRKLVDKMREEYGDDTAVEIMSRLLLVELRLRAIAPEVAVETCDTLHDYEEMFVEESE